MADGAVVVAQLVERSILSTEDRGSNPVIDKLLYRTFVHKKKIKKKEAGYGPFKKKMCFTTWAVLCVHH